METPGSTLASKALIKSRIPHKEFTHSGPIHSLEQAAEERGQRPEQVIRSILFRLSNDQYVLVLVAGPKQVSWPLLRQYLGTNRISMASENEVLQVTGFLTGAVSPFGLPAPLRIIADPNVFEEDEISIGSGTRGTTIIMSSASLKLALGAVEIVELINKKG